MGRMIALSAGGALLLAGAVQSAGADTLVENSAEFRFQLDFHVNDAALQKLLPAGWETVIATQGPAKDANLRLIFIDRVDVTNPDNTPKTTDQLVYVAIPVKQTGTNNAGQMIINAPVPVKARVKEFTYKATGGNIGALFDGTEKVLSWDSFHWYNRGIYNP